MIDSLKIENFRCVESANLKNLGRFNVIVGANASGKTTLLEALFMIAGNSPELVMRERVWRGFRQEIQIAVQQSWYDALWQDLFHQFDFSRRIVLEAKGSDPRSLVISRSKESTPTVVFGEDDEAVGQIQGIVPVEFTYQAGNEPPHKIVPHFVKRQLRIDTGPLGIKGSFFPAIHPSPPEETAQRFSDFSKNLAEWKFVRDFRKVFPQIRALSTESDRVSGLMIYATMEGLRRKVPIHLVSSGIFRWVAIGLSVEADAGGIVIVDEAENGLHYSVMGKLWGLLNSRSKEFGTQVFVSTHNAESIKALLPILHGNEDDFRLIRVVMQDGHSTMRVASGREFESAIEESLEVR